MDINADEFKKLQYNVYDLSPEKSVLKTFPELNRFPEFGSSFLVGLDRDKVIRYVILSYDKKSPLLSEKNLIKRKKLAVEMAGFETQKDNNYDEPVLAMMRNENKIVNRMVLRYVRSQADTRYALLVSGMETFYENIYQITNNDKADRAIDSKEKSDLFEKSRKMSDQLEQLADEIFNNEISLMHTADEVNSEESEAILSYPEHLAKLKQKEVETR